VIKKKKIALPGPYGDDSLGTFDAFDRMDGRSVPAQWVKERVEGRSLSLLLFPGCYSVFQPGS